MLLMIFFFLRKLKVIFGNSLVRATVSAINSSLQNISTFLTVIHYQYIVPLLPCTGISE